MARPLEELAMRFAILVTMSKSEFSGHENELGEINEELWDHYGGLRSSFAIANAKETLKLVIP